MIDYVVAGTNVGHVGLMDTQAKQTNSVRKERPETRDARVQKSLEEERKKVQRIYNSRGKIVRGDEGGRHLDLLAY